jgi:hypothetical protein
MAREFSKLDEWSEWVPAEERDEFESGDGTAMTMELRFLTKEQRDAYSRETERLTKRLGSNNKAVERTARKFLSDNVRNIKNFTDAGAPITDGAQLLDVEGDDKLVAEITQALFDRSSLEAGLAKKLRSPSDSSRMPATSKEDGAAADATQVSPEATQEAQKKKAT